MRNSATALGLFLAICCGGCRAPVPSVPQIIAADPPIEAALEASPAPGGEPHSGRPAEAKATPRGDSQSAAAEAEKPGGGDDKLQQAIAPWVAAGALDATTKRQLVADLQQTDPALRDQLVEMLAAALATRQPEPAAGKKIVALEDRIRPDSVGEQAGAEAPDPRPARRAAPKAPSGFPEVVTASHQESTASVAKSKEVEPAAAVARQLENTIEETRQAPAADSVRDDAPRALAAVSDSAAAKPLDWQGHLDAAIDQLATQLGGKTESSDDVPRHAVLRMLYLANGQREMALSPIPGAPPGQQDFWSKELYGLASYLDTGRNSNPARRAAEAASHLRDATSKLGELATLSVRNLAFCSEVKSYGIYKKFEHYEFTASQELLLYAEVENFKSVHDERGYHTVLRASYEILDQKGARVIEQEFPQTEEHCQNPRRDFFVRYFVTLPPHIYGGQYTLHLYVVDEHSQKMDQGTLDFTVKAKAGR